MTKQPDPVQLQALADFAEKHGRYWKTKLNEMWLNGSDVRQPSGHILRQIRNQFGPAWLTLFKLENIKCSGL